MRYALLPLSILLASCSQLVGNAVGGNDAVDQSRPRSGGVEGSATVTLASNGSDCTARWNGEAVTAEALTNRGFALLERAIAAAGGIDQIRIESLPFLRLEAPPELGFDCAARMLGAIQRAGFDRVALKPAGSPDQPEFAHFQLENAPPAPIATTIAVGPGERMTWNGAPIDLAGLRTRAGVAGGGEVVPEEPLPPPPGSGQDVPPPVVAPPGAVTLAPSSEASFIAVYRAIQVLTRAGLAPVVVLPVIR
ncbi:MAG TPA: hypothetical protein VLK25_11965 [Allosphingosinicella sp.]|nr:hypothetical protein [Allosphingosinicella sp.]